MKTKKGMSIGLALTLMVGVFATMLALGLFTTNEVRAQSVDTPSLAADPALIDTVALITVEFQAGTALPNGGTITIVFPNTAHVPSKIEKNTVTINEMAAAKVEVSDQAVTLTVPALAVPIDTGQATVAFLNTEAMPDATPPVVAAIAGIRNPFEESYTVMVSTSTATVAVASQSLSINRPPGKITSVTVDHTPSDTNANARVTVKFYNPAMELRANLDTITIEFADDVQVPAVLDERFISIVGLNTATAAADTTVASPLDATVAYVGTPPDEPRITLTVGDHDPLVESVAGLAPGVVSIVFRQGAGIKNPTEAGTWNARVTTSVNSPDNDRKQDVVSVGERSFETIRTVSLNAKSGKRGSTLTVTGAGFKNSTTATVFLDEEVFLEDDEGTRTGTGKGNGKKEPAEVVLCDAAIGGTDTFTCDFVVNVPPFSPGTNYINAVDGREGRANDGAPWKLDPQIKATPKTAAIGDTVTVDLLDFPPSSNLASTFDVGGIDILRNDGEKYLPASGMTGTSTHTITIPNGVALGKQALRISMPDDTASRRVTMTITGAQLSVTPSTVVPNQSVTITGHGFTGNSRLGNGTAPAGRSALGEDETTLSGIHIGGTPIDWDKIDDNELIDIDSGGTWVATVVIPVKSPATIPGVYELKAFDSDGRPGVTQITIKPRTVEFEPLESRVGTTVTVTGSGWVASNSAPGADSANISVDYYLPGEEDSDASARANPDSDGNFTATIRVPLNASIPSTNRVEVQYEDDNDRFVTETSAHRVPGAAITITPSSGPGGTLATLSGDGFKAFTTMTLLEVGGTLVQPRPVGPSVNREGVLQDTLVLVPGLDAGTHTVKVKVGDATVSAPFTITDDAELAPVGTTADTTPADAFAALVENMVDDQPNLIGVFRYNDETQAYETYDPDPANAGFNNLDTVGSGDIFWVRLREDQIFLGKLRRAEWAQVVLP